MKKVIYTLIASTMLCMNGLPSSGQFNRTFIGSSQSNVDAGKLMTFNPGTSLIATLETNPQQSSMYDFVITTTNPNGDNQPRMSFLNISSYFGRPIQFYPNNFLYMESTNNYLITGNVEYDDSSAGSLNKIQTIFALSLDSTLNPDRYFIYNGWPFTSPSDIAFKSIRTTSAASYTNLTTGIPEVMMYAVIEDKRPSIAPMISMLQLTSNGHPIRMSNVFTAYNMDLDISSIDLISKSGRLLATGWGSDSILNQTNIPFILDIRLDSAGNIPSVSDLHLYYQPDIDFIGNTFYYEDSVLPLHNHVYFTYSHRTFFSSSPCIQNIYPAVSVLALDPVNLTPSYRRELQIPCSYKNAFRPHLFKHLYYDKINLGFSQSFRDTVTSSVLLSAMVGELNMSPGGSNTIFRYNFQEFKDHTFRSADYYSDLDPNTPSYLINTSAGNASYASTIIRTNAASLFSLCSEFIHPDTSNHQVLHYTVPANTDPVTPTGFYLSAQHVSNTAGMTSCNMIGNTPTMVEEANRQHTFHLFPNPVQQDFTITGKFEKGGQILVKNMMGQLVYQQTTAESDRIHIELPKSLASGTYLVQVLTGHTATFQHQINLIR